MKKHYEKELALVQRSERLSPKGKKEAAEFWVGGIEAINREQRTMQQ